MIDKRKPAVSQALVVVAIILAGVIATGLLFVFKPKAERKPVAHQPPQVEYLVARPQDGSLSKSRTGFCVMLLISC